MLHTVLLMIHFFCAIAIVALVLLQRGKGAEAGAGFGAGASGTVFGARGASTALSRATAILAGLFMVTSLSLAYVGTRRGAAPSSLLEQYSQQLPSTPANAPGNTVPGSAAPNPSPPETRAPSAPAPSGPAPAQGNAPSSGK